MTKIMILGKGMDVVLFKDSLNLQQQQQRYEDPHRNSCF